MSVHSLCYKISVTCSVDLYLIYKMKLLNKILYRVWGTFDKCDVKEKHLLISVLLILALLLLCLVLLVGYIVYQEVWYTLPLLIVETVRTLPVLCNDLSLSPDDDFETFDINKDNLRTYLDDHGRYVCEGKKITDVISKVVERESRLRLSKGLENGQYASCGNDSLRRTSGTRTVSFNQVSHHQKFKEYGSDVVLHWDKHKQNSYIDPAMHYHNGQITIPEGQIYFVYASAHINISLSDPQRKQHQARPRTYSLKICRKHYDYEETLLGTTKLFSGDSDLVTSSLRVEGPLLLKTNERIYVKVSNGDELIQNSHGNTFGLYPM